MREVYLDTLPKRYGLGGNKDKVVVDWKNSIGCKVKFVYEEIEGEVEILDYNSKTSRLLIKFKDDEIEIKAGNFTRCKIGNLIGKKSSKFKIEVGQEFIYNNQNMAIIDRKYTPRSQSNQSESKFYKYKCNICGWGEGWIGESLLLRQKSGCSCCNGKTVVEGINDIPTTAPWMVKYFQGGYEEAKKYTRRSDKKIIPICPDCKTVKDKEIYIGNIYETKSIGCECGDSISYPTKFIYSMLKQLNIDFKREKIFDWAKNKRYDFYIPEINTIIEVNGRQHYSTSFVGIGGRTLLEEQSNDKEKEMSALENGISNYIVIDARISESAFMIDSILNNELVKSIFDISKVNWEECEKFARNNMALEVCKFKKENPDMNPMRIAEVFEISHNTVRRYLNSGNTFGWC
jgi:hypothetical protein